MTDQSPQLGFKDCYSAVQVRELDRRAIEEQGIDGYVLMQRAALAAWNLLQERWPEAKSLWVLCGPGNNGGDGLVLARLAKQAGYAVELILAADADRYQGAAKQALDDWLAADGEIHCASDEQLARMRSQADVIVDGLLGTGLSRPVTGQFETLINAVNQAAGEGVAVLALDIPSGLGADTGAVMGVAIQATACITFIGAKLGLVTGQGPACCGALYFDDLAVPREVYANCPPLAARITDDLRQACLTRRDRTAHKGAHGHLHCLGGDHGTSGAIRIAAEAALRTGAGLVSVSTRAQAAACMAQARPELMASGFELDAGLPEHAASAHVLLVGPGLGQGDWGQQLWRQALALNKPMLVDADGLNLLAKAPEHRDNWVLTPHPGEAARLLACDSRQVQADRVAAIRALQEKYGGVVVLKGAGTLVLGPDGQIHVCTQGNPGMAVGGMGDLLAGIIAGLWVQGIDQGMDMYQAAQLGVYLHACAADKAAAELGERGLLPTDVFAYMRPLLNP